MSKLIAFLKRLSWIIIGVALLSAVYLLPPDTSLAQITAAGTLTACVPAERPPLVTGDPAAPGVDVDILAGIAQAIGVPLRLNIDPGAWAGLQSAELAPDPGPVRDRRGWAGRFHPDTVLP